MAKEGKKMEGKGKAMKREGICRKEKKEEKENKRKESEESE